MLPRLLFMKHHSMEGARLKHHKSEEPDEHYDMNTLKRSRTRMLDRNWAVY